MKRSVITTSDGSTSIQMDEWGETYHSVHGAVQEANHVYIEQGLHRIVLPEIKLLEMGFGTGLNCFLTLKEAKLTQQKIIYHAIEAYPVGPAEVAALNYGTLFQDDRLQQAYHLLHESTWGVEQEINPKFHLMKMHNTFEKQVLASDEYDLVYFDVFGYPYQPELWSEAIFKKMAACLKQGGVLVTYACRGVIKHNMLAAGFTFEIVPGPPGKREMLVAFKA